MPAALPRRTPGDSSRRRADSDDASGWEAFGTPSPALVARSEQGLARFLRRGEVDDGQAEGGEE